MCSAKRPSSAYHEKGVDFSISLLLHLHETTPVSGEAVAWKRSCLELNGASVL